jgi:selenocysteine lyase/cysteine desulfurase
LEHPSNLFPWYNLRDRIGITVRSVEPTGWAIDPKSMIAAIDERTRLVTASIVTFAPGFRTDVIEIGEACRKSGALFLVDAAQAVGVLDIDLGTLPIDAMAVGTPKALLGLYGMGFLFVRAEIAERLRPSYMSGAGIKRGEPECSKVLLAPGAARFDLGNPNHIGCVAAATSIAELMRIGTAKIEAYTRQLAETLSQGLEKHGLPVMTPPDAQLRTNIVAVGKRLESTLESTSDGQLLGLAAHLKQNRVEFSVRRGVLRFSVHAYNAHHDIEKVIGLLGELRL